LADHIVQGFLLKLPASAASGALGRIAAGSYFAPGSASTRSNLFFDLLRPTPDRLLVDVRATGEQLPNEESFVECRPSANYPWKVSVRTALSPADRALVAAQREDLTLLLQTLAHFSVDISPQLSLAISTCQYELILCW
jgi:hypothetical protein